MFCISCFLLNLCCAAVKLCRADMLVLFFQPGFYRGPAAFAGVNVKHMESTAPGCLDRAKEVGYLGQYTSSVVSVGLMFPLGWLSFN